MDIGGGTPTLGVQVDLQGVDAATASLQNMGAVGEDASNRIASSATAGGAAFQEAYSQGTASAQQFGGAVGAIPRNVQLLEQQLGTLTAITASWSDAGATARDIATSVAAALGQEGRMATATAAQIEQLAAATAIMSGQTAVATTVAVENAAAEGLQATATTAATVATVENAAANNAAGMAAGAHGLQLGRLRQELGTMVGRLTGTNTAIDRMGGALGSMVLGNGLIIGVLAGALAVIGVWKAWGEEANKAEAEQKKLTDSLDKWYQKQKESGTAQFTKEIAAMTVKLAELHKEMDGINAGKFLADMAAVGDGGSKLAAWTRVLTAGSFTAITEQFALEVGKGASHIAKEITDGGGAIAAAQTEVAKKIAAAAKQAQLDRLRALEVVWEGALPAQDPATEKITTGIARQNEEIAKATVLANDYATAATNDARLADVQGVAHELLANRIKAETDQRAANLAYVNNPIALDIATKAIQAAYDQDKATILTTAATNDQRAAQLALNESVTVATATAGAHTAALKTQATAGVQTAQAFAGVKSTLENDLMRGIESFATKGLTSFRSFFTEVASMATRMADQINSALAKSTKFTADQISQLKLYQGTAAVVGIGASAGVAGYGIGESSSSLARGGLGGGVSGAATGAAMGSVVPVIGTAIGAVVGGLAGAVGGLLGAADAHRKAADALEKAAASVKISLLQFNAQAGTGNAVDANVAQFHAQADALFNAIDAALPGLKNQVEREKEMAQVRRDETIITQQLVDADKRAKAQFLDDLNVRMLRAQGDTAGADAAASASARANELADAVTKFGAVSDQVSKLIVVQAAEVQHAAAVAAQQTKDDITTLQLRMFSAAGLGNSDQAFAMQQKMEMDNEVLKYGLDSIQVQLLKVAQGDELLAHNQQKQIDLITDQITVAQAQLQTTQAQLQAQQQTVAATRQVVDNLHNFSQSLAVGSLSTLSPVDQMNAAKDQLDTLFAAARGGDQTAASGFGDAARTYLQLAQNYYASSTGYANAFNTVNQMADTLTEQYSSQLDVQTQILNTLQSSNDKLTAQIALLQGQLDLAKGTRIDALLSQINNSFDGNEITRLIQQVNTLGYSVGRNTVTLENGNLNPSGKYFAFGGGSDGIYTPPTTPIDNGLSSSASSAPSTTSSASSSSLSAQISALRADVSRSTDMTQAAGNATKDGLAAVVDAIGASSDVTKRKLDEVVGAVVSQ